MSVPLVSVIIPCYNRAMYVAAAVESVLTQTHRNVEVIAVDDGSSDGTVEILAGFGDRIRVFQQENRGASAARNTGLEYARGDYIVFLDSDDLLSPEVIAAGLDRLQETGAAIVIWNFAKFSDAFDPVTAKEVLPNDEAGLAAILCRTGVAVHAVMFERRLITTPRPFDERLRWHEDLDFWWRLALDEPRCVRLNCVGAYYRQHTTSMSRNVARMMRTRAVVQLRYLERVLASPRLSRECGVLLATDLALTRRQLVAVNAERELIDRAWEGLQRLRKAGFAARHRPILTPLYAVLGSHADGVIIAIMRRLCPRRLPVASPVSDAAASRSA